MNTLEKQISNYILKHGLFHSMIKYKKDYHQLNVIFQRVYGDSYSKYCQEHELERPPINLNWQQKAKLVCETFNQKIVTYSVKNRTKYPVIIKCLNCNQTYEATWDKLTRGLICSCVKSHQHKIVNVDYYIKHYLENEWELLNPNQYKNSNSILKLKHKCGHVITQKGKTLHKNKGVCYNCEKTGLPRKNIWTPQVFAELKAQEVSKSRLGVLRNQIHKLNGKATGIKNKQLIVHTNQGDTLLDIWPPEDPITQKLSNHHQSKSKIKSIKDYARKRNVTILDIVDDHIVEKLECGCIRKRPIDGRAPSKHICPSKAHVQFFRELTKYPLHTSFNDRWALIDYKGKSKPITIKCKKCHHIKTIKRMAEFKCYQQCTCESNISYGERMIFNLLNHNNVTFETQYSLDKKRFDFFLPNYNLLIEYDGIQHTMDVPFWNLTHKDQIHNDRLKDNIAKKHNHKLIRFSHECSIDDIIKGFNPYVNLKKKKNFDYHKPVALLPEEIIDDYITMTFKEITEKYKGQGFALNMTRLNQEFQIKYGMKKSQYCTQPLPDNVLEDFKTMSFEQLKQKYAHTKLPLTKTKVRTDFEKRYGLPKREYIKHIESEQ